MHARWQFNPASAATCRYSHSHRPLAGGLGTALPTLRWALEYPAGVGRLVPKPPWSSMLNARGWGIPGSAAAGYPGLRYHQSSFALSSPSRRRAGDSPPYLGLDACVDAPRPTPSSAAPRPHRPALFRCHAAAHCSGQTKSAHSSRRGDPRGADPPKCGNSHGGGWSGGPGSAPR